MPYLDLLLAIPIAWGMFKGFRRGFILEICTLMALILGIYGAATFGHTAGDYLQEQFNTEPQMSLVLAFGILFIIIVIVVFLFGKLLEGVIKMVALGLVNKLFGLIFGGLKFALILSSLLYIFNGFSSSSGLISDEWKSDSYLYEPLSGLAPLIYPILKENTWREDIKDQMEDLRDKVTE